MLMTQQSNIDPIKRFMKSLAQIYISIIVASPEQKSRLTLHIAVLKYTQMSNNRGRLVGQLTMLTYLWRLHSATAANAELDC